MLSATLHVLGPVTHVLVGVEDEVGGARHVVLTLALAHVVHGAVRLVRVVRDVAVLLLACHRGRYRQHSSIIRGRRRYVHVLFLTKY